MAYAQRVTIKDALARITFFAREPSAENNGVIAPATVNAALAHTTARTIGVAKSACKRKKSTTITVNTVTIMLKNVDPEAIKRAERC